MIFKSFSNTFSSITIFLIPSLFDYLILLSISLRMLISLWNIFLSSSYIDYISIYPNNLSTISINLSFTFDVLVIIYYFSSSNCIYILVYLFPNSIILQNINLAEWIILLSSSSVFFINLINFSSIPPLISYSWFSYYSAMLLSYSRDLIDK